MKTTCLLQTLACLASALPAGLHAQELLTNGNFEGATLAPWQVTAPAGTSVATVNDNSPYRTRYPAGTKAVRLQDDDVEFEAPLFVQSFEPQSRLQFSFDFKAVASAAGSAWYVIWKGDGDTTAFFFSIGGQDGISINLNQTTVTSLEPNMWYHVEGTARAASQTVTGFVLNARGEQTPFTGGFPFGVQSVLNSVTFTDGDQARNGALIVDNISAAQAVLPAASLTIVPAPNGQVTVSWAADGYTLQASSTVGSGAQWANVQTTAQSYTTSADQPLQFFRLISN
jgi:hypothetical protein